MFSLVVLSGEFPDKKCVIYNDRVFSFTSKKMKARFMPDGNVKSTVRNMPAVFMSESFEGTEIARVGKITGIKKSGIGYELEYYFDSNIPGIPNAHLEKLAGKLGIEDFEFHRNHWAVKEENLFEVLYSGELNQRLKPSAFSIEKLSVESDTVAVMMPFAPAFDDVYATIRAAAEDVGLTCKRADEIWNNPAIIQDIVDLICTSKVVIADYTGKNPNVFYEVGIAHALGKMVVPITQNMADVPFDVNHLRAAEYANNREGRNKLKKTLKERLKTFARG